MMRWKALLRSGGLYTYQVPGSFRIEDRLLSAVARERNHFEESEMLALIGGSGFTCNDVIEDCEEIEITTPWGAPSAPLVFGRLGGRSIVFLRRHGVKHEFAPHRVPYRANIWALQKAGVEGVIAVGTVGGVAPDMGPGRIAVPDQLLDYTWGREVTYYDDFGTAGMKHVDMTWPFDRALSARLVEAAERLGAGVRTAGVYACTQGPRLETAAEVRRMCRDGADMIGMTLYPECALARELDLPYAGICVSVNHAAGMGDCADEIDFASLESSLARAVRGVVDIVRETVRADAQKGGAE